MPTATAPKFTLGQHVEVQARDFSAPGRPLVWIAAIVTKAEVREDGLFDVVARTEWNTYAALIVGKRGGNRNIRTA